MSDLEARWRAINSGEAREWWAPAARGGLEAAGMLYCGVLGAYRAMYDLRLLKTVRLPCKVASVGNLTLGGTGKTTTVRWLARRLQHWGLRPAVLSYGYRAGEGEANPGGRTHPENPAETVRIVSGPEGIRMGVGESGDEPQVLARSLPGVPVLTGRRRALSGQRAWDEFQPDACILDDGFQYWRLEKDLELVLVNATSIQSLAKVFPRGTLRESFRSLRRAHGALITHSAWQGRDEIEALRRRLTSVHPSLVLAEARHQPSALAELDTGEALPLEALAGGRWLAVSGLGMPESFERTLAEQGAGEVVPARFGDHHPYSERDLREAAERARRERLDGIVTTEKDSVKMRPEWLGGARCLVLRVDLQILNGQEPLEQLVRERLRIPRDE